MGKVIGICTTKTNDEFSKNYINMLRNVTKPLGYTIAVFHSVHDFYDRTAENGARTIFRLIPYERLCGIIILHDSIFDKTLIDMIIEGASEKNVPVIMARGEDPRCYSISADSGKAYAELLSSVIEKQGIKDTFFIAGRKTDDPDSEFRLSIYKKVLEKNGIEFDENRVEYGNYWETPTAKAIEIMLEKSGRPPRAVFCANDVMAIAVIETLQKRGWRVPQDSIVTGFDGIEGSKYCSPALSTCCENTADLVGKTLLTIEKINSGESVPPIQHYSYDAAIRQSSEPEINTAHVALDSALFYRMRVDEINERVYNDWLDSVILSPNLDNLRRHIPQMVTDGYTISIRADAFFDDESAAKAEFPEEYLLTELNGDGKPVEKLVHADQLISKLIDTIPQDHAGYFSMISKNQFVYGLAFTPVKDILGDCAKINRYINTLNRALYVALCGEKQKSQIGEHYKKKYIDQLTGMLNIDGAHKWFKDTVSSSYIRHEQFSLGIYTFINYQQILEQYGTQVLEENMIYIAKSLKFANPEDAVIARISADSFAVMLLHDPSVTGYGTVDKAITLFYGYLAAKSSTNKENDVPVEVSCGYTDSTDPWDGKLSDFLNAATSNLYRNRVSFEKNTPKNVDFTDSMQVLEYRSVFMTLINDNLFNYHFQPIVDAKTGDIVAYEALMRTRDPIKMSPLEVLSAATMFSKLMMIEFHSFMNIFKRMKEERSSFEGRKVFINTIPGNFLTPELCAPLYEQYGEFLSDCVIEITESETISDGELDAIRTFCGYRDGIKIAVDDYGTGHSNIVNLIEYKPQIVKIDRYLISNIHEDKNKQMFVKNLIEFSRENGIKVLAEGVETSEELKTVISYGVDLIQGYYTAKPAFEVLSEIRPEIKQEIIEAASSIS